MFRENARVQAPPRPFPVPGLADPLETGKHTDPGFPQSPARSLEFSRETNLTPTLIPVEALDNTLANPHANPQKEGHVWKRIGEESIP